MMLYKIKNFSKIALFVAVLVASLGATQASTYALKACGNGAASAVNCPSELTTPTRITLATVAAATPALTGCGTTAAPTPGVNCVANTPDSNIGINTANNTLIDTYLNPLIKLLSVLVGVAVTFGVIYGGIEYSMSAGDPQKASNGRKHIRNAVLALVAYALTLGFLNFIIPGGIAHP